MRKMFTRLFSLTLLLCMVGVVTELSAQCDVPPLTESNVELVTDPATVCDGQDLLYRVVGYPGAQYAFNYDGNVPGGFDPDSTVSVPEGTPFTVQVQVDDTCLSNVLPVLNASIIEPVMIDTSEVEHPLCFGQAGEITIKHTGDHPPYQWYVVPDSITVNPILTGDLDKYEVFSSQVIRDPGGYFVAIQDANNCIDLLPITSWDLAVINPAPSEIEVIDVNGDDPLCVGENGLVTVTVQAGTGTPYSTGEYMVEVGDSAKMTTTQVATFMMPAGEYTATVIDSNMCEVVSDSSAVLVDPEAIEFDIAIIDVTCAEGATGVIKVFDFSPGVAADYQAKVADSAWVTAIGDTIFIENLEPIYYALFVDNTTDVCDSVPYDNPNGTGNVVTVQAPGEITYDVTYNDTIVCYGDSTMITVENEDGGSGNYEYYLDSDNGLVSDWSSTSSWLVGADTDFLVMVRDANDLTCEVPYPEFDIDQVDPVYVDYANTVRPTCPGGNDGLIEIFAVGGIGTYEYSIDSVRWYTNNKFAVAAGDYTVYARDPMCTYAYDYDVTVEEDDPHEIWSYYSDTIVVCEGALHYYIDGAGNWENGWYEGNSSYRHVNVYMTTSLDSVYVSGEELYVWWNGVGNLRWEISEYLEPGVYYIWAKDNYGCVFDADVDGTADYLTITILENETPTVTATITEEASCYENNDGVLTLHLQGEATGTLYYALANTEEAANNTTAGLEWPDGADSVNIQVGKGTYYAVLQDDYCADTTRSVSGPFMVDGYDEVMILDTALSVTDNMCYGDSAGVIVIAAATGGTGDLVYTLMLEGDVVDGYVEVTDTVFTGLAAGEYYVEVTDLGGCMGTNTEAIIIEEPMSGVMFTLVGTDITCYGASDGIATIEVEGGVPGYMFKIGTTSWQPMADTLKNVVITEPGTYEVWVQDSEGCGPASQMVTIEEPMEIILTVVKTDNTNSCTDPNGELEITVTGGVPNTAYTVSVNDSIYPMDVDSNMTITYADLGGGTYEITAMDTGGNFCEVMVTEEVISPDSLDYNAVIMDSVYCAGSDDGVIVVSGITGGDAPYMTTISGPVAGTKDSTETEITFSDLVAGLYTVTVTDAIGCTKVTPLTVGEPDSLRLNATHIADITCVSSGQFSIQATGGVGGYKYFAALSELPDHILLPDPDSSAWVTDSVWTVDVAGTYIVWAMDANECVIGGEENDMGNPVNAWRVKIADPDIVVTVNAAVTDAPLCNGDMTAMISVPDDSIVITLDGVPLVDPVFTVMIDTVAGNELEDVGAGTYVVVVTHEDGCIGTDTVVITEPDELMAMLDKAEGEFTCPDAVEGYIEVAATGGSEVYEYQLWQNGSLKTDYQPDNSFLVQIDNEYVVVVQDTNGCTDTTNTLMVEPVVGPEIVDIMDITCSSDTLASVKVTATAEGERMVYVKWTQFEAESGVYSDSTELMAQGEIRIDQMFEYDNENVDDIHYEFQVIDELGCMSDIDTATFDQIITAPLELTVAVGEVDGCGTEVTITAAGGVAPYVVMVDSMEVMEEMVVLGGGMHTIKVMDAHECMVMEEIELEYPMSMDTALMTYTGEAVQFVYEDAMLDTMLYAGDYSFYYEVDTTCTGELNVMVTEKDRTQPVLDTVTPMDTIADNHPTFMITFEGPVTFNDSVMGYLTVTPADSTEAVLMIAITEAMVSESTITVDYVLGEGEAGLDKNTTYVVAVDSGIVNGDGLAWDGNVGDWMFTTGPDFATDVEDVFAQDEFKVYPNPFNNFIRVDNYDKLSRVVITNIAGQRVLDIEYPSYEIQTGNLVTGVYVVTLIKDDSIVKSDRIIKR